MTRVGVVAIGLALSQLPWSCAGIGAVGGPSTVTHADFILLRACSVAPAIGSAVLAIALLLARRRGAHRVLAQSALLVSFLVLLLLDYAIHWHAGD